MGKISIAYAMAAIGAKGENFVRLFERPSCDISLYKPVDTDPQRAHLRDEVYVIATGAGRFICESETEDFRPGDVFFVPAGADHRFTDFSSNFSTWVIFLGPRLGRA